MQRNYFNFASLKRWCLKDVVWQFFGLSLEVNDNCHDVLEVCGARDVTNHTSVGDELKKRDSVGVSLAEGEQRMPPSRGVYKGDCESQLAVGVTVRRARAAVAEPEFMRLAQPNFSGGRRRARPGLVMQQDQQQQQ